MANVALESEEGKHMCFTTTSSSEDVAAAAFQVIVRLCIHPFLECRRVHMCFDVLPVAAIRRRISAKEFVGCCGGTGNEVVVVGFLEDVLQDLLPWKHLFPFLLLNCEKHLKICLSIHPCFMIGYTILFFFLISLQFDSFVAC